MLKFYEFDKFISEFAKEEINDFWYDDSLFIAQNILDKFTNKDWDILEKEIDNKDIFYKYRLAELLGNNDINEFNILLKLISTDDDNLFEMVIDALRFFKNEEFKKILQSNIELYEKVKSLYSSADIITKKIFKEFLYLIKT